MSIHMGTYTPCQEFSLWFYAINPKLSFFNSNKTEAHNLALVYFIYDLFNTAFSSSTYTNQLTRYTRKVT